MVITAGQLINKPSSKMALVECAEEDQWQMWYYEEYAKDSLRLKGYLVVLSWISNAANLMCQSNV